MCRHDNVPVFSIKYLKSAVLVVLVLSTYRKQDKDISSIVATLFRAVGSLSCVAIII